MFQVRYFVIHPGPEHWDLKEQEERFDRLKWAAETLNRVAERCKELGIGCVLENKLPHLLFAQTSDLLWILTTMDTVEVGVCLDTGHANLTGDIYIRRLRTVVVRMPRFLQAGCSLLENENPALVALGEERSIAGPCWFLVCARLF